MAADRRVDRHRLRDVAAHHREVLARDAARGELAHEIGLRLRRARDDHQAAGVLVEPVHDARARDRGELGVAMQERVQQRAVAVARAGMHDQPRRLVEHERRVVLVHDRERDRLRGVVDRDARRVGHDVDALAARELAARRGGHAVDDHASRVDPRLEPAARMLGQEAREGLVEAQAGALRRHGEREAGGRGGSVILVVLQRLWVRWPL